MQEWPADWQATRMRRVPAGHAGNRDAAEPARAREQEPKAVLARPPSRSGVRAGFRDVPAIREVVRILFDVEYQPDSSYRLLPPLCGPSLGPPGPVRRAPRRAGHHQTHGLGDDPSQNPVVPGPEGPHRKTEARPEHEAWTRRMQPPEGQRTRAVRGPVEDVPVLLRRPPPTSRTVAPYPTEQNRDTWQTIGAPDLLQRETGTGKIAVVPDNARSHHAKALTGLHEPGRLLERITPTHPPPYAPDHQPGRARPEHGQEQHHHHPARNPRRNLRRVRPTHHQPNTRPRLRTPPPPETRNDPVS